MGSRNPQRRSRRPLVAVLIAITALLAGAIFNELVAPTGATLWVMRSLVALLALWAVIEGLIEACRLREDGGSS